MIVFSAAAAASITAWAAAPLLSIARRGTIDARTVAAVRAETAALRAADVTASACPRAGSVTRDAAHALPFPRVPGDDLAGSTRYASLNRPGV